MQLSIVLRSPAKMAGKAIAVHDPEFFIGRDPDCQLRPTSMSVSRHHCALFVKDDRVRIHDFASANGTFVNGRRVSADVLLHDGDEVQAGPLVFEVHLEQSAAEASVGPAADPAAGSVDSVVVADMLRELPSADIEPPAQPSPVNDAAPGTAAVPEGSEAGKDQVAAPQAKEPSSVAGELLKRYFRRPRT